MIARRSRSFARTLLMASVASAPLMIAASGTATAQSASPTASAAADAYAKGTKGPAPVAPPPVIWSGWSGFYGGVSFGAASTAANALFSSHQVSNSTSVLTSSVQQGTTITDQFNPRTSSRDWGGLVDIYLGYNFRLGSNWILGAQFEGTVTNNFVQLTATQNAVSNSTTLITPAGLTSTSQTVVNSIFLDGLAQRWAVSALARAGWLIDPRDLVYVIGGYTYGGFEWGPRTFGLNGATVGAGWEHQLAPAWTLRAEYRYTRFEDKDFSRSTFTTSNTTNVSGAGIVTTNASTSSTAITERVSGIDLHALRFGITHYFGSEPAAVVAPAFPLPTKGPRPVVAAASDWTGLYGGVSFGAASFQATTSALAHAVGNTTNTSGVIAQAQTSIADSITNGSGRDWGGLADIYLGYHARFGSNLIAGLQVEGTIANKQAAFDTSTVSRTNRATTTTPAGTTATASVLSTSTSIDALAERWAVSVLARAGWLIDPRDLVYVIGGYTYGGFEWGSRVFGLNGATVGGGWEHQIAPSWTLKAEYRYTWFEDKDLARADSSTQSSATVSPFGNSTSFSTTTTASTDRVSGISQHALRVGLTHYFGSDALAATPGATAMVVKAPPPVAMPSWAGPYGGVSFGITSMEVATDSTLSSPFVGAFTFPGARIDEVQDVNAVFNTRGRKTGAVADIVAGYNVAFGRNIVAGVQGEGSLVQAMVTGDGTFRQVFTVTDVETPPGGAAGTSVQTGSSASSIRSSTQARWMVSALGRAGWLIDPRDLIYVIGGWTYGHFTSDDRVFALHGPTVGAGIERKVGQSWTVKAEYRYTHFLDKDVTTTQPQVQTFTAGTQAQVFTGVSNQIDHFSVNMHTVRLGLSYYFASR
jgi:opacity protein-like surface antigen